MSKRANVAGGDETSGRRSAPPADVGFAADVADRLAEALAAGRAPDLHGVVVVRHGLLALEHYGVGEDFSWGDSLGTVAFEPETLHDVRSVSKSVVGLLYGIALGQGIVPQPEEHLLAFFPEYQDLAGDRKRARLTIEHALTMTLGLEWNEDLPYTSLDNSEIAMEFAPDRYRYILERPIAEEPGSSWHYCGGASALLGTLIARGAGRSLPEFARDVLFEPLGIGSFEWMEGEDGEASAASGLRLAPRDLARIGQVVLTDGNWDVRKIVPTSWLDRALRPHVTIGEGFEYGYQWYLSSISTPDGVSHPWVGGIGNGGQRLFVVPDLDLVVAIAAGAYDGEHQSSMPSFIFEDVIVASVEARSPFGD